MTKTNIWKIKDFFVNEVSFERVSSRNNILFKEIATCYEVSLQPQIADESAK
jgi:hypothetical protein